MLEKVAFVTAPGGAAQAAGPDAMADPAGRGPRSRAAKIAMLAKIAKATRLRECGGLWDSPPMTGAASSAPRDRTQCQKGMATYLAAPEPAVSTPGVPDA